MTTELETSTGALPWLMGFDDDHRHLTAQPVDLDRHLELVHGWMQEPHVVPWWRLDGPVDQVRSYLQEQIDAPHLQPWVVAVDRRPFAYVETYRAADDPLADHLRAAGSSVVLDEGDRGWHVLVGPPEELGTGASHLLGRAVLQHLFADPEVTRVVCEPDERNERMLRFCAALGHEPLDRVEVPGKRAVILAVTRDLDREDPS